MNTGSINGKKVRVRRGRLTGYVGLVLVHRVGIDLVGVAYRGGIAVFRRGSVEVLS